MRREKTATFALVAVNIIVFVLSIFGVAANRQIGVNYIAVVGMGQWYRPLTALFGHFGLMHLVCNMLALSSLGSLVETAIGKKRFLAIYLLGGTVGNLLAMHMYHFLGQNVLLAGASTAIFALMGHLVYAYTDRDLIPYYHFGGNFLREVFLTFLLSSLSGGSLAGHLCGFIAGFFLSKIIIFV